MRRGRGEGEERARRGRGKDRRFVAHTFYFAEPNTLQKST